MCTNEQLKVETKPDINNQIWQDRSRSFHSKQTVFCRFSLKEQHASAPPAAPATERKPQSFRRLHYWLDACEVVRIPSLNCDSLLCAFFYCTSSFYLHPVCGSLTQFVPEHLLNRFGTSDHNPHRALSDLNPCLSLVWQNNRDQQWSTQIISVVSLETRMMWEQREVFHRFHT